MKKITKSLLLIIFSVGIVIGSTSAYFSDDEISTGNVLGAGKIDLKIGNQSYLNGDPQESNSWDLSDITNQLFFDFNDLKPGDLSEDTISLEVDSNDSWICANISLTSSDENEIIDPEEKAGDDSDGVWAGELDDELTFVFWEDDGDNVFETDEEIALQASTADLPQGDDNPGMTFPITDSTYNLFGDVGEPFASGEEKYIGKAWCFGELELDPVTEGEGTSPEDDPGIACDGSLVSNLSQSDILTGDIRFSAMQYRGNTEFTCTGETSENEDDDGDDDGDDGEVQACSTGSPAWANRVVLYQLGTKKNGELVNDFRRNPDHAFGPPDSFFYSIGYDGWVMYEMEAPVIDVSGVDLSFHEVTNGRTTYPVESVDVEVSQDGYSWYSIGQVTNKDNGTGVGLLDFSSTGLDWVLYVKLTETSNIDDHDDTSDGYDLAAIDGVSYDSCADDEFVGPVR